MALAYRTPERRDTAAYRAWKAEVLRERPICEHCNLVQSRIVAHVDQPCWGAELMDKGNVLALCLQCDREYSRSHPPLRRRKPRS